VGALLTFDPAVAEMFFAPRVLIVEGDTEFAAFGRVMDEEPIAFPAATRPLVVRARGKTTIPTLMRMLTHFKVDFAVLHDIDSPSSETGKRANPAYAVNRNICAAVANAGTAGVKVVHRCSCPEFEREHGMEKVEKDKPYEAWKALREPDVRARVLAVLKGLMEAPGTGEADRQSCFDARLRSWLADGGSGYAEDPAFTFRD
jgi:putative ATP-dependent endonuclease of the OLD family